MRFTGKTILVTGAASGIGLAVAERLAEEDAARLILVDRDAEALAAVRLRCTLDLVPGDVADEAFWDTAAPYLDGATHAVVNGASRERGRSWTSTSRNGGASCR